MRFEIGELVELVWVRGTISVPFLRCYIGSDVTIYAGPFYRQHTVEEDGTYYHVRASDGKELAVGITCLRKKKPPEQDKEYDGNQVISIAKLIVFGLLGVFVIGLFWFGVRIYFGVPQQITTMLSMISGIPWGVYCASKWI